MWVSWFLKQDMPDEWKAPHLMSIALPGEVVDGLLCKLDACADLPGPKADMLALDDVLWVVLEFVQERMVL